MDIEVQLIVDGRKLRVMPDLYTRMVEATETIPQTMIDEVRKLSGLSYEIPTGCAFCAFREQRGHTNCRPITAEIKQAGLECGEQNLVYVDPSEMYAYNVARTILGAQS